MALFTGYEIIDRVDQSDARWGQLGRINRKGLADVHAGRLQINGVNACWQVTQVELTCVSPAEFWLVIQCLTPTVVQTDVHGMPAFMFEVDADRLTISRWPDTRFERWRVYRNRAIGSGRLGVQMGGGQHGADKGGQSQAESGNGVGFHVRF